MMFQNIYNICCGILSYAISSSLGIVTYQFTPFSALYRMMIAVETHAQIKMSV